MTFSCQYLRNFFRCSSLFLILLFCAKSHAVLLNFDELNPDDFVIDPEDVLPGDYSLRVLFDYYQDQGVVFLGDAFVLPWPEGRPEEPSSAPNYIGGPGASISFIGDLPTFVSLVVFNFGGVQTSLRARGPNNYYESLASSGYIWGMMGDDQSTPYIHNQLISFYSPTGISEISISGKNAFSFDDLTFTYDSTAVDEPPSLLVLLSGLLVLVFTRFRQRFSQAKV